MPLAAVTAAELAAVAVLPGVLLLGAAGITAVVAIGSALIALGGRRTRDADAEEVPEPARP